MWLVSEFFQQFQCPLFCTEGNQVVTPYSRCVVTNDLYNKLKHSQSRYVKLLLTTTIIPFPPHIFFLTPSQHCKKINKVKDVTLIFWSLSLPLSKLHLLSKTYWSNVFFYVCFSLIYIKWDVFFLNFLMETMTQKYSLTHCHTNDHTLTHEYWHNVNALILISVNKCARLDQ